MQHKTIIEPFRIKSVEPISVGTEAERTQYLKDAHYNPFLLRSDNVVIDFMTDSGTSAMSARQWAGMMEGDEAYAGSRSWERMEREVRDLTGMAYILPTHQGRAAERIIYGHLGGPGKVFISNTHFDTTRANIEFSGATAIDIPIAEGKDTALEHPFKGNMDVGELDRLLKEHKGHVGAVILTVTNNSGGGQPVSMANAESIAAICKRHGVLYLLDCCRIAENSWFIKHREEGMEGLTYRQIAQRMFALTDGAVMSAKKDALVNMGGFLALKDEVLAEACINLLIITEGFATYGGLSGRDMEAIAIGLQEIFDPHYLDYRIKSTLFLGKKMHELGVPLMMPIGGHAVYVDAKKLYPHIPPHEYPGQALVGELYKLGGIRTVEIGSVMFGTYNADGTLNPAPMELVRLAIPRRVYTQSHIEYVVETFEEIMKQRDRVRGLKITKEPRFLRHFTAHFEPLT
ncbi:MAG: tryptophanase [Flavobacteriales bacterium]|jgi:tryptophanase|nr:tryptophanase [Flavobacteriales bacterium]MBK6892830.1 tryptophanase [Flavobacteriales bacterium]MBK7246977.1 tryptophanase [Flavobacteriales bacterium]MBK9599160.1 tryptophanase [Flavobacteriales bacterium]QQS72635.1 MAG: tryptophanase [Flavobacteriales bacterium]